MKNTIGLLALGALFSANAHGGIDFSKLPVPHTVEESAARFDEVARLVVRDQSGGPVGVYTGNGLGFTSKALAKLAAGVDVEEINRVLADPSSVTYAKTGTDFHDVPFCQRTGDYDFGLRGLVKILGHFGNNPALIHPTTRRHIIDALLSRKGGANQVETTFKIGVCGTHNETENHILMTEGSRYLTNQFVMDDLQAAGRADPAYDNERNGMNAWMLKHLQGFFQHDFYEYNARPYQAYTLMAIENIAEFARDARVKLAATMLLNYLDAKYAVSSDNLRRYVPFRRQPQYRTRTDLVNMDDESNRMTMLAGATALYGELPHPWQYETGGDRMLMAALDQYRTPSLILDLMVNREHARWFQAFHHYGIEIYASSPGFLLSAGGIHVPVWDFFSDQMNGWALSTTVMPTRGGLDASQFVRFAGAPKDADRVNTCVAAGFACGLNPVIPATIPAGCRSTDGPWTFLDFTSPACPLQYGFFTAVYAQDGFGFLESAEPTPEMDFGQFRNRVLASNGGRSYSATHDNDYVTTAGRVITFRPQTTGKLDWSIRAIDRNPMVTDMNRWPLAFGDVIRADGQGLIEIRNPALGRQLTLDMRDAMNPKREETQIQRP